MSRLLAVPLVLLALAQPAPHTLTAVPITLAAPLAHLTAAYERTDGSILLSDATTPIVVLLNPATGATTPVGSAGAGAGQYVQPGGFYKGAGSTILLADHSGPRAHVIDGSRITSSYSTAVRGTQSSSDGDVDFTRMDAGGFAYFVNRFPVKKTPGGAPATELVRLDPAKQTRDVVGLLAVPREEQLPSGDNMTLSRSIIGEPADAWGVLPDGRIAIVRAAPYRVEWRAAGGAMTSGPPVAVDAIPFTDADKAEMTKGGSVVSGAAIGGGGRSAAAEIPRKYAATKPPFFPSDVVLSPTGRVWVLRTQPFGATTVLYDVFDQTGARVDRVQFPATSRVIGFGPSAVYVREGAATLRKYKTS